MKITIEPSNPKHAFETASVEVKRDDLTFDEFLQLVCNAAKVYGYGDETVEALRKLLPNGDE